MSAPEPRTWFVPGRIEVFGKHTDYAGGRSLSCAIDRGFSLTASARADSKVTIADTIANVRDEFLLGPGIEPRAGDWSNYARTVCRRLARNFPGLSRGVDIIFHSNLPPAAGLSSSSALMIAIYLALAAANDLEEHPLFTANLAACEGLAGYLACVESGSGFGPLQGDFGVGTTGGAQDHTTILCSRAGELRQCSFAPTRFERTVSLPVDAVFAVAASGVAAEKTAGALEKYNRAASLAHRVLERWRAASGRQDVSLASAIAGGADAPRRIRDAVAGEPELLDRFDQFFEENEVLVPGAGDALAAGDLGEFGRLADRSQQLAEEKLRNQVPETIGLQRLARSSGAIAASAFGAGFGGSVWALVPASQAETFMARWREAYAARFPHAAPKAQFFITRPSAGAREERSSS